MKQSKCEGCSDLAELADIRNQIRQAFLNYLTVNDAFYKAVSFEAIMVRLNDIQLWIERQVKVHE